MAPTFTTKPAVGRHYAVYLIALLAVSAGCDETGVSGGGPRAEQADARSPGSNTEVSSASSPAPARTLDKTFDDIKFDIEKGESFERSMLNDQVKQLFGERIRIRGYIFPTFRSKGIKQFVLVRDNQECCFGPGAALYDCIRVTTDEGKSIEYTRSPVAVEGVFKLEEQFIDPERTVGAVFHLEDSVVN